MARLDAAGVRQTDLKGENIVVDENDNVHIIDAGSFAFEESQVGTHPPDELWCPESVREDCAGYRLPPDGCHGFEHSVLGHCCLQARLHTLPRCSRHSSSPFR